MINIITEFAGTKYQVNTDTGEIREMYETWLPVGSKVYTPEQQEAYKKHQEAESRRIGRKTSNRELGTFAFININNAFDKLKPANVARLIYLSTFLSFGSNILMKTERTAMRYDDLSIILNCSGKTVDRFWKEVSPQYITLTDDGLMLTNDMIFLRNKIKERSNFFQKVYKDSIRKLFRTAINLNYVGYIFRMLTFINIEYNILCRNPEETKLKEIQPITIDEFCEHIGYSVNQKSRIINTYKKIKFNVNGREERLIAFVDGGLRIVINPRVIYSGSDFRKVQVLTLFYD